MDTRRSHQQAFLEDAELQEAADEAWQTEMAKALKLEADREQGLQLREEAQGKSFSTYLKRIAQTLPARGFALDQETAQQRQRQLTVEVHLLVPKERSNSLP
mmetsp:Transcript_25121/g.57717  ORF Transcript_25121/g.57717 Transcript_25121/m.57717 type:complete len:102 (+) Transcript_25121:379-684(+)